MPTLVIYVEHDDSTDTLWLRDKVLTAVEDTVEEERDGLDSSNLRVYSEIIDDPS